MWDDADYLLAMIADRLRGEDTPPVDRPAQLREQIEKKRRLEAAARKLTQRRPPRG